MLSQSVASCLTHVLLQWWSHTSKVVDLNLDMTILRPQFFSICCWALGQSWPWALTHPQSWPGSSWAIMAHRDDGNQFWSCYSLKTDWPEKIWPSFSLKLSKILKKKNIKASSLCPRLSCRQKQLISYVCTGIFQKMIVYNRDQSYWYLIHLNKHSCAVQHWRLGSLQGLVADPSF